MAKLYGRGTNQKVGPSIRITKYTLYIMNKTYNPQLLHTVVSGTGMSSPRVPNIILGEQKAGGYAQGDLMDANAVVELINKATININGAEYVTKEQVLAMLSELINGAPEQLDTLGEIATALGEDADFKNTIIGEISSLHDDLKTTVDGDNLVIGK